MTNKFVYPNMETVIDEMAVFLFEAGHEFQTSDKDKFDNILARVEQYAEYNPDADIFLLTAVLIETVVQTHALVDGNKRLALILAYTFMGLNGYTLDMREVGENSAHELIVGVVKRELDIEKVAENLRNNIAI